MDIQDRAIDNLKSLIFDLVLDLTESGISFTDINDDIIYWNNRLLELWSVKEEDIAYKPRRNLDEKIFLQVENLKELRDILNQIQTKYQYQTTTLIKTLKGKYIELKTVPVMKNGQYQGRIWYFKDITEQKKREVELETYADHLQRTIASRTQELINAEKLAASGNLAREITHDLRSPLQSIRNAVYMMKKDQDKFDVGIEIIEKSVLRSLEMLQSLRTNMRQQEPMLRRVDLSSIIRESVEQLPKPENVSIHMEFTQNIMAWVDASQMRRVFDNLLLNALEAMPHGGTITVNVHQTSDKLIIQISDTGVGIPEDVLLNLFNKKFYTTKPHGLGLGLSYCKRVVESHGGSIMVDSVYGKGTVFTIELPKID